MPARRRVSFTLSFDLPAEASTYDARQYVVDAVQTMKGCLHPGDDECAGDPMRDLDSATVRVAFKSTVRK